MATPDDLSDAKAEYPWSKAFVVTSCLWVVAAILYPSPFALVLLIVILPLNLVIQRVLIHPARIWPGLARHWVRTAVISVLVFAMPVHIAAWSQRTAKARFRQFVLNPIPAGVSDISKREAMGMDGWITINFTLTPEVAEGVIRSRPFQLKQIPLGPSAQFRNFDQPGLDRLQFRAGDVDISTAAHYLVWDQTAGESFHFIVSSAGNRACFIYERQ